jgi:hypothetical protein
MDFLVQMQIGASASEPGEPRARSHAKSPYTTSV